MKTLQWAFLLAMQSNRSAEFFILDSPALIPKFPQSPSGSYLFSHLRYMVSWNYDWEREVSIALKLLPVFTLRVGIVVLYDESKKVSIALRLLPVFTQLLLLMQKTCAFLNPKILTSLSNPI